MIAMVNPTKAELIREYCRLVESHAELIVALGNYADEDMCVCEGSEECCTCIAQGVLDRARKL